MATTLRLSASLNSAETNETLQVSAVQVAQAGDYEDSGMIDVATTETTHTISTDIGNVGLAMMINRDPTNFVDIGTATGVYPLRLNPGEAFVGRLAPATATLYFLANTANVKVQFKIYED